MTRITVAPAWEWLLVWYFFLGGLAAGLYFMAALIELVGSERDRAMAKVAYYCAFPLAVVCGVLLIVGLGRWRTLAEALHRGPLGTMFALLCAGVGFFLASYTGVLLAASNQPFWSDTRLLGGLFLASAAATGTALMLLLRLPSAAPASLARLQRVNSWALGLELLLLIGFLVSLGGLALPLLQSPYGRLLIVVT